MPGWIRSGKVYNQSDIDLKRRLGTMGETDKVTTLTAESFMRSLAQQLAHQMGGKVEDFKYWTEPKKKTKEETA